ncbi:hypothetical protein CYMTET_49532 [Cymbomonas tetramitiformis]|uniref:Ion transport domain-containing protein n=1 Tax=Cymbomonas tetramitiformis TaxID=36881 RepID=A0AAE0EUL6_9CHLO|nr:hypothetical protein CYMTET_49532 [Cymbomonas tetramitiformis]
MALCSVLAFNMRNGHTERDFFKDFQDLTPRSTHSRNLLQADEDILVNCNLYNLKNYKFTPLKTKDEFPPKTLEYRPRGITHDVPENSTFSSQGALAFHLDHVYFREVLKGSTTGSLIGLQLDSFEDNFETAEEVFEGGLDNIFSTQTPTVYKRYLGDYAEITRLLAFERPDLGQLVANTEHLAWVESDKLNPLRHRLNLYDISEDGSSGNLNPNLHLKQCTPDSFSEVLPSICSTYLSYQGFDHSTNSTSVWLHELEQDSLEDLGDSRSSNYVFPQMSAARERSQKPQDSCTRDLDCEIPSCHLAWIETKESVALRDDGQLAVLTEDGGLTDARIRFLGLPQRTWIEPLFPDDWQLYNATTGKRYTVLQNIGLTGDMMYLLLTTRGDSSPSWVFRRYDLYEQRFFEMGDTVSSRRLLLDKTSDQGLTYWRDAGDANFWSLRFYAATYVGSKKATFMSHCEILTGVSNVSDTTLYKDVLLWVETAPESDSGTLRLLDINKDNDLLPDVTDHFPLFGEYMFDSDNDEVGDEGDLITAYGPCTRSSTRGACMSDDVILYIVWSVYVVLVVLVVAWIVRWFKYTKKLAVMEQAQLDKSAGAAAKGRKAEGSHEEDEKDEKNEEEAELEPSSPKTREQSSGTVGSRTSYRARISSLNDWSAVQEELPEYSVSYVKIELIVLLGQILLLLMTLVSVILASYPFYSQNRPNIRIMNIFVWVDFYITFLFLMDLVVRFHLRNLVKFPTAWVFFKKNWTDCLALFTDIPGVTNVGALQFLVLTRFRHVIRLFRLARFLKVFRVVRMYRRFTRQNVFVDMMINRPTLFLLLLMSLFVLTSSLALKMLEQNGNPDFESLLNVVWFTMVTITTVGYGDMVPKTILSRIITVFLMVIGIGILGLLTATLLKKILLGGKSQEEVEKRRAAVTARVELLKNQAVRMAVAYNPMIAVYDEKGYEQGIGTVDDLVELNNQVQSSFLNVTGRIEEESVLPLEVMMTQSGGKFKMMEGGRDSMGQEDLERKAKGEKERNILEDMFGTRKGMEIEIEPMTKLVFICKYFKLDDQKEGVSNFQKLISDLVDVMFEPPRRGKFDNFLEKVMTIKAHHGNLTGTPDLNDPADSRLVKVEEVLRRHKVSQRPDFQEILLEIVVLVFMYDRVQNARFAVDHLAFKEDEEIPDPLMLDSRMKHSKNMLFTGFDFADRRRLDTRIDKKPTFMEKLDITFGSNSTFGSDGRRPSKKTVGLDLSNSVNVQSKDYSGDDDDQSPGCTPNLSQVQKTEGVGDAALKRRARQRRWSAGAAEIMNKLQRRRNSRSGSIDFGVQTSDLEGTDSNQSNMSPPTPSTAKSDGLQVGEFGMISEGEENRKELSGVPEDPETVSQPEEPRNVGIVEDNASEELATFPLVCSLEGRDAPSAVSSSCILISNLHQLWPTVEFPGWGLHLLRSKSTRARKRLAAARS